jgi:integrase/recombinase XerC
MILPSGGCRFGVFVGRVGLPDLAGAAHLELVSGVVQLRPEDAMFEAMLSGWRAQQAARGLREDTIALRERLVRRFGEFTGEYPWAWSPGHVDEWSLHLTAEEHLAPSTIRAYQCMLRQFTEFVVDGRYGWAAACEEAFGPGRHPVAICHEGNTIAHLNDYEGNPEARPFTREELQRFLDYADDQVERAVRSGRKGALAAYRDATIFKVIHGRRAAPDGGGPAGRGRLRPQPAGASVRLVRHAERPLWQGEEGAAAAAAERAVGDGLGGRGGR